jgi:hypothetical protein
MVYAFGDLHFALVPSPKDTTLIGFVLRLRFVRDSNWGMRKGRITRDVTGIIADNFQLRLNLCSIMSFIQVI